MKSPLNEMKSKIRKADREYKERYGREYCLFKTEYGYEIAQHAVWYMANERFDSLVICEIAMETGTKSFYDACVKAYDAGFRGVINSDVERMRNGDYISY